MRRALQLPVVSLLLAAWSFGCAVGPNYKRPQVNAPETFRSALGPAEQASFANLPWWQVFRDPTLQHLIEEALANNYDLRVAVSRVEQARQLAAQARAQFFPQFDAKGTISVGRNAVLGNPFALPNQTPSPTTSEPNDDKYPPKSAATPSNRTPVIDSVLLDLSAAWEVDLWGRIRRLNEAARAVVFASEDARRGVTVSLVASVAQAYFELLELDLELQIARKNTESFSNTLKLFTERFKAGVASKLETSTAEAALATTASTVPELERQIVLKENQINVLLGRNPGPVERNTTLLEQAMPPEVPAGLPSELLERRPDIREAEDSLREANARIGVAVANFFPQISLTALLGKVSDSLSGFTSGASNLWDVAGNLTGPIFHGGALVSQYRQAQAAWEEARLSYEQTVLNGFQEISNALISREKLEDVRAQQARAVKAYEDAVRVAILRYIAGRASYYEVLQNQQLLFPAETSLARTRLNQFVILVQLYKALGGGWQEAGSPIPAEPVGAAGSSCRGDEAGRNEGSNEKIGQHTE